MSARAPGRAQHTCSLAHPTTAVNWFPPAGRPGGPFTSVPHFLLGAERKWPEEAYGPSKLCPRNARPDTSEDSGIPRQEGSWEARGGEEGAAPEGQDRSPPQLPPAAGSPRAGRLPRGPGKPRTRGQISAASRPWLRSLHRLKDPKGRGRDGVLSGGRRAAVTSRPGCPRRA